MRAALGAAEGAVSTLAGTMALAEIDSGAASTAPTEPAPGWVAGVAGVEMLALSAGRETDARLDRESGAFYVEDEPLELTPREQAMLKVLIAKPGHAVSKERLFRVVFADEEQVHFEAIEVVAHRLRKKLTGTKTVLMTLRGLGYLLREDTTRTDPEKSA